jgi:hypothetical protein
MKFNDFFCLIIFIFVNTAVFAQIENDSVIYWSKKRKLKWCDFQTKLTDSAFKSKNIAVTSSIINYISYLEEGMPNYRVLVYFKKFESWTKDTNSLYILNHEQMHFNITEIYARKGRKAIRELRTTDNENIDDYKKIIHQILEELDKTQDKYDNETQHSINNTKQQVWDNKIIQQLEDLKDYEVDYVELTQED